MILILLSWIFLAYSFITFGTAMESVLRIPYKNITLTLLLGIAAQTVMLCITAFFVPLGWEVLVGNLLISSFFAFQFRTSLKATLNSALVDFKSLSAFSKAIFHIIVASALLKCAQSPFILDNESYYVQTIKWTNEYGFVKGLGNLNVAFGQTSPWHVLQAGFNFSFLTQRINDINGFLMVICSFFMLFKFDKRLQLENRFHWIGFVLLFNVLTFQFVNAPSPDFPVFMIVQVLFYLLLKNYKAIGDTKIIIFLLALLIFIKITIAPLGLILLLFLIKKRKELFFLFFTSTLFGGLWIAKNAILTGYPLYPFEFFALNVDWKMPESLLSNINNMIRNHEFMTIKNHKLLTILDKFIIWIQFSGITGIFNKGILLLFMVAPFTKKMRSQSKYKVLYVALLLHFVIVFIYSPQFRFFLAEFIFLSALVIADILNRMKMNPKFVYSGLIVAAVLPLVVMYLLDFKTVTDNKFNQKPETLSWSQLFQPELNSKHGTGSFEMHQEGNLNYYSPNPNFFFYGTADGPLPCTNVKIINSFKRKYHLIPQLRTSELNDGFRSFAHDTIQ